MKLQKLLFFSNADFIVKRRHALIDQEFEAWDYGPVLPSVYQEFKSFKDKPIKTRAKAFDPVTVQIRVPSMKLPEADRIVLKNVFDFYKKFSAVALSDLSHSSIGPWRQARSLFANGLNPNRAISNELILEYHRLFDS